MTFIMLCGPHGSGKTTLINALRDRFGDTVQFIPSVAGKVIKERGYTATENLLFNERISVQTDIIHAWKKQVDQVLTSRDRDCIFISDRSPIDSLAYMMTDAHRELSLSESHLLIEYDKLCKTIYHQCRREYGAWLAFIPPWKDHGSLASTTARGDSKAPCGGYALHHEYLIRGILQELEQTSTPNEYGYRNIRIEYLATRELSGRCKEFIDTFDLDKPYVVTAVAPVK